MEEMGEQQRPNGRYPQINVNTAVSFSVLVIIVGGAVYLAGIAGNVDNQKDRLKKVEATISEAQKQMEDGRYRAAVASGAADVRLARIEFLLQDLLTRVGIPDRARPPQIPQSP